MDAAPSRMSAWPRHLDRSVRPHLVDPGGYDTVHNATVGGM